MAVAAVALAGVSYASKRAADAVATGDEGDGTTALDYLNPWGAIERQFYGSRASDDMQSANMQAFLAMIRASEGTNKAADPWRVCYGYRHTIADLSDHPAVTGEWRGEPLPPAMCEGAGLAAGCVSTAAGAYQMIKPTWLACKRALGLQDFGRASQDAAALYLIRQRGAVDAIESGRVADAIALCKREWASLPGAGYGQPERKLAQLVEVYQAAGGAVA